MELCIDVGNTTIGFGFYLNDKLIKKFSIASSLDKLADEYYASLKLIIEENKINPLDVDEIMFASVVPSLNEILLNAVACLFSKAHVHELTCDSPHDIEMDIDNPKELGSDLIADLVGAKNNYPLPLLIVDLGTATKLLVLTKEGVFTTALIMPGVEVSAKSLFSKAALLPEVDLKVTSNVLDSKNTINCIKHGIIYGHLESINGLASRIEEALGYKLNKVVTGGNAFYFRDMFTKDYKFDENLVLNGEHIILKRINN